MENYKNENTPESSSELEAEFYEVECDFDLEDPAVQTDRQNKLTGGLFAYAVSKDNFKIVLLPHSHAGFEKARDKRDFDYGGSISIFSNGLMTIHPRSGSLPHTRHEDIDVLASAVAKFFKKRFGFEVKHIEKKV